jgi:signal peptidase I
MKYKSVALFLLLVAVFAGCSDQRFIQQGGSMSPTIQPGETVSADMTAYEKSDPRRWDIVVFNPTSVNRVSEEPWIMRVIGLPGEQIDLRDDGIYVNGERQKPPQQLSGIKYLALPVTGDSSFVSLPFRVRADSYFLLGDNSNEAIDSRYWGALRRRDILGRVKEK